MNKRNILFGALSVLLLLAGCRDAVRQNQQQQAQQGNDSEVTGFFDNRAQQKQQQQRQEKTTYNTTDGGTTMMEIPARLTDRPEKILKREGFTVSYNKTSKTPNWVAWHLTKAHTYGRFQRNEQMFSIDEDVPTPRATDNDYYNSRYDRGHLCPAGDNKWDKEALRQSFLFTNICPQNHGLNKNAWNDLEIQCREWARQYGAIDIVCGPIYRNVKDYKSPPASLKTIGRNKVWVPDAFFKVILCRKGQPKALAFIYENRGGTQRMEDCLTTVDEVERLTGIDFYPALADNIENKVEAESNYNEW